MYSFILIFITIYIFILAILFKLHRQQLSLAKLVLCGLVFGTLYGFLLKQCSLPQYTQDTIVQWTGIISNGYLHLLQMIIMPLVATSMLAAVFNIEHTNALGKMTGVLIAILLLTTALSALIGIAIATLFDLSAIGLIATAETLTQEHQLADSLSKLQQSTLPEIIVNFIPTNPFADFAGMRPSSLIGVVFFSILLGISARSVKRERPEMATGIEQFVQVLQAVIMRLVKIIMAVTPYGICALTTRTIALTNMQQISQLFNFILASYIAILCMFLMHLLILLIAGVHPIKYLQHIWPVLTFAFSSRSSAATIPINVETQIKKLSFPAPIASLSTSLGSTIGQNGCAGIYPSMLAMMAAPSLGIDPLDLKFITSLIGFTVISSFGIAGGGGGATFAALVVLPMMGLPVTIVPLLISIEPLLDMARTMLNVNGTIVAGTLTHLSVSADQANNAISDHSHSSPL